MSSAQLKTFSQFFADRELTRALPHATAVDSNAGASKACDRRDQRPQASCGRGGVAPLDGSARGVESLELIRRERYRGAGGGCGGYECPADRGNQFGDALRR